MNSIDIVGVTAAILSTFAAAPQLVKILSKSNSTKDLSMLTQVIHFIAAVLWAFYGFYIDSYILCIECIFVSILYLLIILAMIRDYYFTTTL